MSKNKEAQEQQDWLDQKARNDPQNVPRQLAELTRLVTEIHAKIDAHDYDASKTTITARKAGVVVDRELHFKDEIADREIEFEVSRHHYESELEVSPLDYVLECMTPAQVMRLEAATCSRLGSDSIGQRVILAAIARYRGKRGMSADTLAKIKAVVAESAEEAEHTPAAGAVQTPVAPANGGVGILMDLQKILEEYASRPRDEGESMREYARFVLDELRAYAVLAPLAGI